MTRRTWIATLGLLAVAPALYGLRGYSKSRTHQSFGAIVARVQTADPVVALTFDDGPWAPGADSILRILERDHLRATFFLVGAAAAVHPADVRSLVQAGHELGNHSFSHSHMVLRSLPWVRREVERTDSVLRRLGYAGPIHFRAPYGMKLLGLPWYLASTGRINVMWDVEPDSYAGVRASPGAIAAHVAEHVRPGSIILLHPWGGNEADRAAIPRIVRDLRRRGFEFVTVTELLQRRGS